MANSAIALFGVDIAYDGDAVVRGVDLEIAAGELHVLLGESGSGKTTILRAIAGFEPICDGRLEIHGTAADGDGVWVPPERRGVGVVFQDYALFPHLDVAGNVGFGLRKRGAGAADALLERVGLSGYGARPVADLSGGEQQRVALARALAQRPRVILLDEPLSNLNPELRQQLRAATVELLRAEGISAVFVTHDRREAFDVADRISVIHGGRILQTGAPRDLYEQPKSVQVARSVGATNELPCTVDGTTASCALGLVELSAAAGGATTLILRPEQLAIDPSGDDATVVAVRYCGASDELEIALDADIRVRAHVSPGAVEPDQRVGIAVKAPAVAVESD